MIFRASGCGRGGGCAAVARSLLLAICGLALSSAPIWAEAEPKQAAAPPPSAPQTVTLRTLVVGGCQEAQRYAESLLGSGAVRSVAEIFETVIRFLAEGAASGLNVIAVYVTEILRVTGVDVAALPRFTPEGVSAIAQWGLLALIAYWVLTVLLRLLMCVAKRVFWVVKTVLALWMFGLIVTDKTAGNETTAVRVGGLVLACVLLSMLTSDCEKRPNMDHRLSTLEGRLRAVEKRKAE